MYTIRRHWWDKHGKPILLVSLAIITALALRQTQGAAIFELYQLLTRPFQSTTTSTEWLSDAKTKELQARLTELNSQNQKLKQLLGYAAPKASQPAIVAPVVGRSADHWWEQVTLGRGSQSGIQTGFVVTAPGGLVGRIVSVTPNTSRVLLVSDPTSQLGVTVSRSRHMGFLRGQSENRAVMQFFDKVPNVRKGDAIVTSQYSEIFPAGLPIGRVESVDMGKSPAPEATISLLAPLPYLEWVVVYPKTEMLPQGGKS